jgi:hypothetical protein
MRDDLHRTVPVSRAWRKVLKYASRAADWIKSGAAIEVAVRGEMACSMKATWLTRFEYALKTSITPDMFGLDRVSRVIDDFERRSTTATEANLCEIVRGLHARDGETPRLFQNSVSALCKSWTDARIEQVGAIIRQHVGPKVSHEAMSRLRLLAADLTFDIPAAPATRKPKKTDEALLNSALKLGPSW